MADWVTEETKDKLYSDIPGLKSWIIRDLKRLNVVRPTPVQWACIPPALQGRDVIGSAKTGSGKTIAFVLPILNKLSSDPYGIFALVLTPTRELAFQIGDQFKAVGTSMGARVSVIVGGQDRLEQGRELKSEPHVVVATPGRMVDFLSVDREFTLKKIKFLVLDEADRLLDGRFDEQMGTIMEALPAKRQTLLFSATITEQIQKMEEMAKEKVFRFEAISRGTTESTVDQLEELYTLVNPKVRDAALVAYLLQWREQNPKQLALIFLDTCALVETLGLTLQELGMPCVTLHSYKTQKDRLNALVRFKSSQCKFMVATDLASRGLDIPLVSLVVNHRMPNCTKTYIHRVGRTARAGRAGTALTIITPEDQNLLLALEAVNPRKLVNYKSDSVLVRRLLKQINVTKREQEIKLEERGFAEKKIINKRKELILKGLDPDEECAKLEARIRRGQERRRSRFLKSHGEALDNTAEGKELEHNVNVTDKTREKAIIKLKQKGNAKDLRKNSIPGLKVKVNEREKVLRKKKSGIMKKKKV